MNKYKKALIIGRFQPFHNGHLYLLKKTLKIAEKVVIGIGSASIFDINNPLDYETRRKVIKSVFYKEKLEEKLLKVVPLEDFFNDKKWLENVKKQVGKFDIIVSNNNWTNEIMEKAGFIVKRFPYYKRSLYEGWRIRELIRKKRDWKKRVPNYLVNYFSENINNFIIKNNIFKHVVIGGTFDHFHKGHEELIKTAFIYGSNVTIGIATEELYKNKKYFQSIESIDERKKSVSDFLIKNAWHQRAKIILFEEFTGGADKVKEISAIVVSSLTYPNAMKINDLREKRSFDRLRIIIVKNVLGTDEKLLTSQRIRSGEINRSGELFDIDFKKKKQIILKDEMREDLRKPLGKVFKTTDEVVKDIEINKPVILIAVGDVIVDELLKNNINPDIKIIDFKTKRQEYFVFDKKLLKEKKYINKPGTLNIKSVDRLKELIKDQEESWLIIKGEEDLLTLPAILFSPLNSYIVYGHWQYGIIGVKVTLEIKEKIKLLLKRFKI